MALPTAAQEETCLGTMALQGAVLPLPDDRPLVCNDKLCWPRWVVNRGGGGGSGRVGWAEWNRLEGPPERDCLHITYLP